MVKSVRFFLAMLAVIAVLFFSAFKGGSGFTIEIDDSFAISTEASDVEDIAERLNLDEEVVASYFDLNDLKLIAVSEDTKTQIRISRFADNFSSSVYDAENLTEAQIGEMLSLYGGSNKTFEIIENDSRKFAKITETLKDSGGVYTSTQYVTVAGGRTYVITCYNPSDSTSAEVEKIFSTFTVRDMTTRIEQYKWKKNWIIPGIVAMCIVLGIGVFGLCKKLYEQ